MTLYTYSLGGDYGLTDPVEFNIGPNVLVEDVLDTLGKFLSKNYFYRYGSGDLTNIKIEATNLTNISTPTRDVRIGVINLIDPDNTCMRTFFQGSAGGRETECQIFAPFMQPHLNPPLLDGLVLLYNGELLTEMDHVNFEGINIPRFVDVAVRWALKEK